MRLCDLREKEVINVCDCKRLGFVEDLILDLSNGCLEALIVPEEKKFCGFLGSEREYVIPYECIQKIGSDIIMVEISEEKCLKGCKD